VMYCALCVGSLGYNDVIGYMVVPFHISSCCSCITFTTRCDMLS
jgi:hypothetical protein